MSRRDSPESRLLRSGPTRRMRRCFLIAVLAICVGGCSNESDGRVAKSGAVPISRSSQVKSERGSWRFDSADVDGEHVPRILRIGLNANPRFPPDAWAELKVPSGFWALSGRLGVADVPLAPSVVLFLEIVQDGDIVLWRGPVGPDGFADIPSVGLPSSAGLVELHAGFESDHALAYLVLAGLSVDPV